ncbi:MAG: hydroxyacid dehydrogenase [Candidatus Spechtbacterales bacterium]
MSKMKVLITDPIHMEAINLLKDSGLDITYVKIKSKEHFLKIIPRYDALICRTSTKVTSEVITSAKRLRCIGVAATGWDHIDVDAAAKRGIILFGLPPGDKSVNIQREGSFLPTAEHTILAMLAAAGNFYQAVSSLKAGKWEKYNLVGTELYGKTLGIVGLGRIGGMVAQRAAAFGMKVVAYDPHVSRDVIKNLGVKVKKVSLAVLCKKSDFITIHAHKTPKTTNLLDQKSFALMKNGVIIINTARPAIINERALMRGLASKRVRCAVLDVFENEPNPARMNMDLIQMPNVIATPHIAGVSEEAWKRVSLTTAKDVIAYLKYGKKKHVIL